MSPCVTEPLILATIFLPLTKKGNAKASCADYERIFVLMLRTLSSCWNNEKLECYEAEWLLGVRLGHLSLLHVE